MLAFQKYSHDIIMKKVNQDTCSDEMLFSFLQMNDMHMNMQGSESSELAKGYPGKNERARWLINAVEEGGLSPKMSFILGLGDLVDGETPQEIENELKIIKTLMQGTGLPFYPLIGNHEVHQQEGSPVWETPFLTVFDEHKANYAFQYGGILFIMLNNSGTGCVTQGVYDSRAQWLRLILEASSIPKIICCHVPLIPVRDSSVLAESFGFISYYALEPEILELIHQHLESTLAVLSGHLHLTGVVFDKSICHISISGTASYPSDFAVYSVFRDRIEVEVTQVSEELLTTETNIHGQDRHGKDFVDDKHPTHIEYIKGNPEERTFTIPMKFI